MRRIERIVLHCSDSDFGSASLIDEWHRSRGFSSIGYHYVVLNPYKDSGAVRLRRPEFWRDGVVENGRDQELMGAHTKGYNRMSIGICLIGRHLFTMQQFVSLIDLLSKIRTNHPKAELVGHYELLKTSDPQKTCPNIDMEWLRGVM